MTLPSPVELKKFLISRGFEVYRTLSHRVQLAERVRDNLLMDGAVAACTGDTLAVRLVTRAQHSDFPTENDEQLLGRAHDCAALAVSHGYQETERTVVPIYDPGDGTRTLDTWYEVAFIRQVADLEELVVEVRFALALDKVVSGQT